MNPAATESTESESQRGALLYLFPLLTVDQACEMLDDPLPRTVEQWILEGALRGWNLAEDAKGPRSFVRVALYSVLGLMNSGRRGVKPGKAHPPVEQIFPHSRPNFHAVEVARFFQCTLRHIQNLSVAKEIDGPQFSPRHNRISRQSLIDFLNARELHLL